MITRNHPRSERWFSQDIPKMDTLLLSWSRRPAILHWGFTPRCRMPVLPCFLLLFNGSRRIVRRHSRVGCRRPKNLWHFPKFLHLQYPEVDPGRTALYLSWLIPLTACKPGANSLCPRAACSFQQPPLSSEETRGSRQAAGFDFSVSLSKA